MRDNIGKTVATPEEYFVAFKTVWGEARGEKDIGRRAVAHVILNRWKKGGWFGQGLAGVCLKAWQFSAWNENDPNRAKIDGLQFWRSKTLQQCALAFITAMGEEDMTKGATHYHRNGIEETVPWAQGQMSCVVIGNHTFYNTVD